MNPRSLTPLWRIPRSSSRSTACPPVAGVEVEMALRLVVEVGLLEDERHAEHPLPEVDGGLPVGPDDRDVVDALALELAQAAAHAPSGNGPVASIWFSCSQEPSTAKSAP